MFRFSFSGVLQFLIGILLIQAATGAIVVALLRTDNWEAWALLAMLSLLLSLLAALWFASIAAHVNQDTTSHLKAKFSREREKIQLKAEQEKSKVIEQSHQRIIKDRDRTQAKANRKIGLSFAGVVAIGAFMLFTQFITIGVLMLTTTGGALAGYTFRARQNYLERKRNLAMEPKKPEKLIGSYSPRKIVDAITGKNKRPV
ncbi:MAG: hypothetical protein GY731_01765 [Gammaproteobacteria bacterium]|nr:hypothetical protein [Gammaproteobacteria bacterium]